MDTAKTVRRVIQVNKGLIGPVAARPKTVRPRRISEYPTVSEAQRQVAQRLSSPLLLGPPICDELLALVQHTFTEEEASVVRHLRGAVWRTAPDVARRERRTTEDTKALLNRVAIEKRAIASEQRAGRECYKLLPVVPGMFEMVLITQSPGQISPWHRRFAELFEALFNTGYLVDYQTHPVPSVRFLPVGPLASIHPAALPCEQLEVVLDRFQKFGVGNCQCRLSAGVVGHACDKPLEVCTVMGEWAERGIQQGWLRAVSRKELLDIKRGAEAQGLVTWIMNVESTQGQVSCSCCGCCCKAMRVVNEFNAPGMMAPPHFLPRFDSPACTYCGQCARQCPMGAITIDTRTECGKHPEEVSGDVPVAPARTPAAALTDSQRISHQAVRCIGCGLCSVACSKAHAIRMDPVPDYQLPYKSWLSFLMGNAAGMLKTSWDVWRDRRGTQ